MPLNQESQKFINERITKATQLIGEMFTKGCVEFKSEMFTRKAEGMVDCIVSWQVPGRENRQNIGVTSPLSQSDAALLFYNRMSEQCESLNKILKRRAEKAKAAKAAKPKKPVKKAEKKPVKRAKKA